MMKKNSELYYFMNNNYLRTRYLLSRVRAIGGAPVVNDNLVVFGIKLVWRCTYVILNACILLRLSLGNTRMVYLLCFHGLLKPTTCTKERLRTKNASRYDQLIFLNTHTSNNNNNTSLR